MLNHEYDDDVAQVEAARKSINAFAPIYHRYSGTIYRWMYRESGDADVAADLTAQTFLNAMKGLSGYDATRTSSFRSWLFAIARNVLRDSWRRYQPTPLPADLLDHHPGPEELALQSNRLESIRRALGSLPERQREIVELRLSGLSLREIGEIQGTGEGAVKAAQGRAFKTLRALLYQEVTS